MTDAVRAIALSLGGEAGSRLASSLAMPTRPDTLLRRLKQDQSSPTPAPPPRVVGVEDWAIRKGHPYGTRGVDLQRGRVLDRLPGRAGESLKAWLRQHPPIEWLSRDRWPACAFAATEAAPQAKQVADRWHLKKNAREALERFLERHPPTIRQAFAPPPADEPAPTTGRAPASAKATGGEAGAGPPSPSYPRRLPIGNSPSPC